MNFKPVGYAKLHSAQANPNSNLTSCCFEKCEGLSANQNSTKYVANMCLWICKIEIAKNQINP